jgi:7-dehydrocholesterol reductase
MEDLIIPSTASAPDDGSHAHTSALSADAQKAGSQLRTRLNSISKLDSLSLSSGKSTSWDWGRAQATSLTTACSSAGIMVLCPLLVIFTWIALESFNGSLLDAGTECGSLGPWDFLARYGPAPSWRAGGGYACWVLFQALLYTVLPAKLSTGQLTPAGYLLKYYTNGLLAWVVTHVAFAVLVLGGWIDGGVIARHWEGLLVAANGYGFVLSAFAYWKAHAFPTHVEDRKFSGSWLYDIYMGVEFNPRFGQYWDFKLFHNGRPGIIAWTLIDLSFLMQQHSLHGRITNSMLIATILHATYVLDFFINEDWYLRTIDICHDHFGFYLAWGSMVWLPAMYTLQCQYLARHPDVELPPGIAVLVLATGLCAYGLFRSVNHQKDLVRRTAGECLVWGRRPVVVRVSYVTKDGKKHESLLLASGWWGVCRHANYLGDLVLSYSMCATCGVGHVLPWIYAIFMTVLLVHRVRRDEERCRAKYGGGWAEYERRVRWALLPGIW